MKKWFIKRVIKQYVDNKEKYNELVDTFRNVNVSRVKGNYFPNPVIPELAEKSNNIEGSKEQEKEQTTTPKVDVEATPPPVAAPSTAQVATSSVAPIIAPPVAPVVSPTVVPQISLGKIDIKNYISPDTIEDIADISTKKMQKKTESLSKIPDKLLKETSTEWEPIKLTEVNERYKLYLLAEAEIKYDPEKNKILYKIIEPKLSEAEERKLELLKRAFVYVFERTRPVSNIEEGYKIIEDGIIDLSVKYDITLSRDEFEKIKYYLIRDFFGLEMIEPLMHDTYIEDISCDGLNIPIFVNHLKYGSLEVNRKYTDLEKLNSFIIKLAQKSNQEVSLAKPILQGALPDGSRVEAIYGKEISQKGSSFTIRKFREKPFTPIHLIEFGTCPPFLLSYLWIAIENKQSILISGGTATGKTTVLNALSLFIPPTSKVVSIEDTPEINLPHEHWLPLVARESSDKSEVTMFDLLKASLRERPEYIIVGEIRGKEAVVLFQGMATGHAGLGTVHAETFEDLVNRMTIEPISLPKNLLTEVDIVLFQRQVKIKNNLVRRTSSVIEVLNYIPRTDSLETNEFVRFKPADDTFIFNDKSGVINNLLEVRGTSEESIWKEIEKRKRILYLMYKKKIREFNEVSEVIRYYYKNPYKIFDYIENYEPKNE